MSKGDLYLPCYYDASATRFATATRCRHCGLKG